MPERPATVSRVGWSWLVIGGVLVVRALFSIAVWRVLRPAAPTLLRLLDERRPENRIVAPVMRHIALVQICELLLAAFIVIAAWRFLRLSPWARPAIQVVCGLYAAYFVGFAALFAWLWPRLPHDHSTPGPFSGHVLPLAGVEFVCIALAVLLVQLIRLLSSPRVREAFRRQAA